MASLLRTLRTHKKKSALFSVGLVYGLRLGEQRFREQQLMTQLCKRARLLGERGVAERVAFDEVTVLLNPAANNGKARRQLEKYCAPILHLSGLRVSVVRMERNTSDVVDALLAEETGNKVVLVAGGDGTLMETITAIMRHQNSQKVTHVGVLPLGKQHNSMAKRLFPNTESQEDVRRMAEAALACVENVFRPVDILQVENIEGIQDESVDGEKDLKKGNNKYWEKAKKLYALTSFEIGAYSDVHRHLLPKFWYLPGLKAKTFAGHFFAFLWASKHVDFGFQAEIRTIDEEIDDLATINEANERNAITNDQGTWNWLLSWIGLGSQAQLPSVEDVKTKVESWSDKHFFKGFQFSVTTANPALSNESKSCLIVQEVSEEVGLVDFVSSGLDLISDPSNYKLSSSRQEVQSLRIYPEMDEKDKWFMLDNEPVELLGPMQLQLLPSRLYMFCDRSLELNAPLQIEQEQAQPKKTRWWQSVAGSTTLNRQQFSNT